MIISFNSKILPAFQTSLKWLDLWLQCTTILLIAICTTRLILDRDICRQLQELPSCCLLQNIMLGWMSVNQLVLLFVLSIVYLTEDWDPILADIDLFFVIQISILCWDEALFASLGCNHEGERGKKTFKDRYLLSFA